MKRVILFTWNIFCMVSTCTFAAMALFTTLAPTDLETKNLWEVLLLSFLCTICSFIYPWNRAMGNVERYIRIGIHYLLINVIILGFGSLFEWYHFSSPKSLFFMIISIAAIFAIISGTSWSCSAKDAKKMNEKLEQYQEKNNI